MGPASLRDVFLRESILKALGGDHLTPEQLRRRALARVHPDVFPPDAPMPYDATLDALLREGAIAREGARLRFASEASVLPRWFDALGGLTPIEGNLYRCPLPYAPQHVDALRRAGIRVLFSFESAVQGERVRAAGIDWRPRFWLDNGVPTSDELHALVAEVNAIPADVPVAMHCKAGLGRTGIALAAVLAARDGGDADAALEKVWRAVPLSRAIMLEYGQADFVRGFVASASARAGASARE